MEDRKIKHCLIVDWSVLIGKQQKYNIITSGSIKENRKTKQKKQNISDVCQSK